MAVCNQQRHRGNRVFEGDVGSPQKMAGIWWQEENRGQGEDREESTEVDQADEAGRGGKAVVCGMVRGK